MLNDVKVFPYGYDGDYTSKCHPCLQLRVAFPLNCSAKVRRKFGICNFFQLIFVKWNVKKC